MTKRHLSFTVIMSALIFLFHSNIYGIEYVSSFGGIIRGSVVYKGYAYLAQRDTIRILDIRDKKNIREVGTYIDTGLEIYNLAIKWPVIYYEKHFRSDFIGIGAVDISDPSHPRQFKFNIHDERGNHLKLNIKGSWLRAQLDDYDEWIYDISDPFKPTIQGLDENHNAAIEAMNKITTPSLSALPHIPQEIIYDGCVENVTVEGDKAYIIDKSKGVKIIAIADPRKPKYLDITNITDNFKRRMALNPIDWNSSITMSNKYLIDSERKYDTREIVKTYNISNPVSPKLIDDSINVELCGNDYFGGLRVLGSYLFILTECHRTSLKFYGLSIFNIKDIEKPKFVGAYPEYDNGFECGSRIAFETEPGGIAVSGDMIYIASKDNGLTILRLTKENKP